MCLSCKTKRVWSFVENRMTGYPIKFDHNEVEELRKKYQYVDLDSKRSQPTKKKLINNHFSKIWEYLD